MPVLVIPLLTSIIAGLLMIVVLGKPIALADGPSSRRAQLHERLATPCSSASSSA